MLNEPSKLANVSPIRYAQWALDNLAAEISPHLQLLRQSENLTPEELFSAHSALMNVYGTQAQIHNLAELFGDDDRVSSVKYCSYNAQQFIQTIKTHVERAIDCNNIYINSDISSEIKTVILDARRTSLILYNLISNAIIHSKPKEKHITIKLSMQDDNLVILVTDNGNGIPMTKRKNLFSAFENGILPASIAETGGGYNLSGLGLSVAQKAARDMKGELRYVPSRDLTKFEFYIPQTGSDRINVSETIMFIPDIELINRCFATVKLLSVAEKV